MTVELEAAQRERASARRHGIEKQLVAGEFGEKEIQVGLKAFHRICDNWAIDSKTAEEILFDADQQKSGKEPSPANLLERISYTLRIYRLVDEVVQGDDARKQRWIRRANPSLSGRRPIDLMSAGPTESAKVMEYLEYCKHGHSA